MKRITHGYSLKPVWLNILQERLQNVENEKQQQKSRSSTGLFEILERKYGEKFRMDWLIRAKQPSP